MVKESGSAIASPNIAFIKYWGNKNSELRLPSNGSLSMTLNGLETRTTVYLDPGLSSDSLIINGETAGPLPLQRVSGFLDILRQHFNQKDCAAIESNNNFPPGTGIASSASAFAALAAAYTRAIGEFPDNRELSILSRFGSGSASRSIHSGFVEWYAGEKSSESYAEQIAPPSHWNLVDLIIITGYAHKKVGSFAGHALADTSPLQHARVQNCRSRLDSCRTAILNRDFELLAEIAELDSNLMHAVMLTSSPPLIYWEPATILLMKSIRTWREEGLPVFYTIDAGPNVHCFTTEQEHESVLRKIKSLPSVQDVLISRPGEGIRYPD
ncbi:MAG: diphosphomevalonate decarboxylase [Anaerolineales bacterium]|nr:diphosphomevalonate decarboxylase [Anaerolineales bacterium]